MGKILPTITLQIGDLDDAGVKYPLRFFLNDEHKPEADEFIPKEEFNRDKWDPDPIKTFREEPDASDEFKEIGKKLYSLIHRGKIGEEWDRCKAKYKNQHRVQLNIEPARVGSFPWELAHLDNINWLATNAEQTFIRYYKPGKEDRPVEQFPTDTLPLRVLIVIGSEDDDTAVLPLEEVRGIEAGIHDYDRSHPKNQLAHRMIDIEVLKRPNLQLLEDTYKEIQPHIFHFIGHGGLKGKDESYLLIKYVNKEGELAEIEWTYDMIFAQLQAWEWIPRFVFINACRSEVQTLSSEEIQEQAWSIGNVFRRLGVPAVLTMQADIDGKSAGIFGASIYKSLAKLELLDAAVGRARNAVLNSIQTLKKRDWAIPVLTVTVPPEKVLPFKPPVSNLTKIKDCEAFKEIEFFSDRAEPRRKLIRGFYPLPPSITDKNLIIVKGKKDAGKTWLAKWFLEVCALLGNDVRYVEVGGDKGKRWLDLLLQIRHGDDIKQYSSLIYEPLDESAFYQFYWELENRYRGSEPPAWNGQNVTVKDDYQLADSQTTWTPNFYTETIPSFRQALVQSAEINKPLIIVLDHFEGILEKDMREDLIPGLIRPAALGELKQSVGEGNARLVKLVLVLTDEQFDSFDIKNLVGGFHPVPINFLSPETFFDIASEYLRKVNRIEKLGYSEKEIEGAADGIAKLIVKNNHDYSLSELKKRFG